MSWLKDVIGTEKAIIAMCHFQPLPGDPYYDESKGMDWVVEQAHKELISLQRGGVDAIMFSNEFSLPYLTKVRAETVAAMSRIIGQLMGEIKVPFGVNALWDPIATIDLAAATGAKFAREIFTGVYASDFGLWNTNCGETIRHRKAVGAESCRLMYNIVPEGARYLVDRPITEIAKTTVFACRPDALCISGITAGADTDSSILAEVKNALPETVVFANTGCRIDTIERQLSIADGAVVATTFKKDGIFENMTDTDRVEVFMDKVRAFREKNAN